MFKSLFGLANSSRTNKKNSSHELPPLEDADYEYLFLQLLEGVGHGWQQDRILRFFRVLGDRGKPDLWLDWLNRYQEKLSQLPTIDNNLAMRMVQMGERHGGNFGEKVYEVGMRMLTGFQVEDAFTTITEDFEQQPLIITQPEPIPFTPEEPALEAVGDSPDGVQTVSLNELLAMMQSDDNLRSQIANQFGIESDDPVQIIEELIQKLQISQ